MKQPGKIPGQGETGWKPNGPAKQEGPKPIPSARESGYEGGIDVGNRTPGDSSVSRGFTDSGFRQVQHSPNDHGRMLRGEHTDHDMAIGPAPQPKRSGEAGESTLPGEKERAGRGGSYDEGRSG